MNKSPAEPPRAPASPLPARRWREPDSTPAGIFSFTLVRSLTYPVPLHTRQGVGIISPVPPQVGQVCENCIKPPPELTWPRPPHVGQVCLEVPGSAPLPEQAVQGVDTGSVNVRDEPKAASSKSTSKSYRKSAPRAAPPCCDRHHRQTDR